jgi:hypothetical protein
VGLSSSASVFFAIAPAIAIYPSSRALSMAYREKYRLLVPFQLISLQATVPVGCVGHAATKQGSEGLTKGGLLPAIAARCLAGKPWQTAIKCASPKAFGVPRSPRGLSRLSNLQTCTSGAEPEENKPPLGLSQKALAMAKHGRRRASRMRLVRTMRADSSFDTGATAMAWAFRAAM